MNPISVFNAYISYTKSLRDNGLRRANFPEGLSEALAGHTLSKYYSRNISKAPTGDLIDQDTKLKYEINPTTRFLFFQIPYENRFSATIISFLFFIFLVLILGIVINSYFKLWL